MRNVVQWVQQHTPGAVAEVGKILLGAGIGGWLAWGQAVSASYAPHRLHYVAGASILATGAIVLGVLFWWLAAKDDPRVGHWRDLYHAASRLLDHQVQVSGGATATGPAGPFDPSGNRTIR